MHIKIGGKIWPFEYCRLKDHGHCDGPHVPGKRIRINKSLQGEARLEATIHEMLHAADWQKDEEWVEEIARDFARTLTRLGYTCAGAD